MSFLVRSSLPHTIMERVRRTPEEIGFQFKPVGSNEWSSLSFRHYLDRAMALASGLSRFNLQPKDTVAIFSRTRFEWSMCDTALMGLRCIVVPIYPQSTPQDVLHILKTSRAKMVIFETAYHLESILAANALGPHDVKTWIAMDRVPTPANLTVLALNSILEEGAATIETFRPQFESNMAAWRPDDVLSICYTSGTTGIPRGALITQSNMTSALEDCAEVFAPYVDPPYETILSFLPLSHILGKFEAATVFAFGWKQAFAQSYDNLAADIRDTHPTLIFGVPLTYERAYQHIMAFVEESPKAYRLLFEQTLKAGLNCLRARMQGKTASASDRIRYYAGRPLIVPVLSRQFGGKLRLAISGGAPLNSEISEFFQVLGLTIYEGYGLTETCGPVTLNTPKRFKTGSVGMALPEVHLRIANDGEILIQSHKVFKGYLNDNRETENAIRSGWLYTGDIGRLDDEGFLFITDRKKEIIVTSAGKNIAPQKIESLARSISLFEHVVVLGDRKPHLCALITLKTDKAIQLANDNHILFSDYTELVRHHKLIALVQQKLDRLNERLGSYERIRKFLILPTSFSVAGGELTPTGKMRRKPIFSKYGAEIERLYSS